MRSRMKKTIAALNASAKSITLCVLLFAVLGFDFVVGVNLADHAVLATIALALIVWLFYRSRGSSCNKTA